MILYVLLRPVSRPLMILAACFCLIGIAIEAAMAMYLIEPLLWLGSDAYLQAFTRG